MNNNYFKEEVFDEYYDSAGNYHFIGTHTGKHIIPAIKKEDNNITKVEVKTNEQFSRLGKE